MSESDAAIVRRSLHRDPSAFGELFWRHDEAVHAYLARRAGPEAADDLVAEVWLRAFKSRRTFDTKVDDARPWLYGIARFVLLAHWRRKRRVEPGLPAAVRDPWPSIDERLDVRARRAELFAALASLSEGEREVLLLTAWEQLSASEIARALDLPASTVRNRLHRARRALRAQVGETSDARDLETEV